MQKEATFDKIIYLSVCMLKTKKNIESWITLFIDNKHCAILSVKITVTNISI